MYDLLVVADRFKSSTTKPVLWRNLTSYLLVFDNLDRKYASILGGRPIINHPWIGGSFVSAKDEPDDIDLTAFTDAEAIDALKSKPGSGWIKDAFRARAQVGAEADARFQKLLRDEPLSSDELETAMRVNRLTAMRAIEPDAKLDEEITIRLISEQIRNGLLMPGTADPILRNLQKAIRASADKDIQLGIVGISSGSTVLHVCPVYPHGQTGDEPEPDDDHDGDLPGVPVAVPAAESPVDGAMHQLLELFDAAQNDEPLRAEPEMLEAFEGLVRTLDKRAIDVDFGWHADTGTVRTGRLTAEGRQYAQRRIRPQIKRSLRTMRGLRKRTKRTIREGPDQAAHINGRPKRPQDRHYNG